MVAWGQCDTLAWQRLSLQAVIAGLELPGVTTSVGSWAPCPLTLPLHGPSSSLPFLSPFCPLSPGYSVHPAWSGELLLLCYLPCPDSRCFQGFRTQGPWVGQKGELSEPLMRKGYLKKMEFEVCLQGLKKGWRCCEPG